MGTRSIPEPQVPRGHYWSREYNSKARINSFWHQLDEILEAEAGTVLEVGPGPGIVTDWMRRAGVSVTTVDIDESLGADVTASVSDLPFDDDSFDAVLCSQILEHMPFDHSQRALTEIGRVARSVAVISLPDSRPWAGAATPFYYGYYAELLRQRWEGVGLRGQIGAVLRGRLRLRDFLFLRLAPRKLALWHYPLELLPAPVPHRPWSLPAGDEHFWEIGSEDAPFERVLDAFDEAGLDLVKRYRVPQNPWHHFFVLRPRRSG